MKIRFGKSEKHIDFFPEHIYEIQAFVEKKFKINDVNEQKEQNNQANNDIIPTSLKWSDINCFYYDSEADENLISEDDDL